jgi:hypothetical protein
MGIKFTPQLTVSQFEKLFRTEEGMAINGMNISIVAARATNAFWPAARDKVLLVLSGHGPLRGQTAGRKYLTVGEACGFSAGSD